MDQYNVTKLPEFRAIQPPIPAQPPFGMTFREWLQARRDLQAKKTKARDMVKRVAKNGINPDEGYRAVEAADVYDMMRPILSDCELGFEVEVIGERMEYSPNRAPITKVDLQITYMDLETGYFEHKTIVGAGLDWQDKGVYKAYTGGTKYALILEFLIPTGGNDPAPGTGDPETDATKKVEQKQETKPSDKHPETPTQQTAQEAATGRVGRRTNKDKDVGKKVSQEVDSGAVDEGLPGPATVEQVSEIRERVGKLNDFPGQPAEKRTRGIMATYMSIAAKLKCPKLDEATVEKLNTDQAGRAVLLLDEWLDKRAQIDNRNKAQEAAPE